MATLSNGALLAGPALTHAIQRVTAGRKVRCAVAFWSVDGIAEVFPSGIPSDAKVLCDILMGGTSEDALRKLSGALGEGLKHAPEMHAKVYMSSAGAVVASANASKVAMTSNGRPGSRLEVGTFSSVDSAAYKAGAKLFATHFEEGRDVGEREFAIARRRYRPPLTGPMSVKPSTKSLLEMVIADPSSFRSIGFVFTSIPITEEERADVRRSAQRQGIPPKIVQRYKSGTFAGWKEREVKRWPRFFFEFYQPKNKLWVYGRRMDHGFEDNVLANSDWAGVKRAVLIPLPSQKEIEAADASTALRFRSDLGGRLFETGDELARIIRCCH